MSIQFLEDDTLFYILEHIPYEKIVNILQKVNKELCKKSITYLLNKSNIFGGYRGLQYDIIFNQIKTERDRIISSLRNSQTWNKQNLNMIRWSKHNSAIYGLYNLYKPSRISLWLGLSNHK